MGVENDKKDFDLAYVTQHITLWFSLKHGYSMSWYFILFLVLMFGKPECDVSQPEPHSGEACNTLSHKGLTNVNIQKEMLYCHCYIL